jgi:hypothetical protein
MRDVTIARRGAKNENSRAVGRFAGVNIEDDCEKWGDNRRNRLAWLQVFLVRGVRS